MNKNISKWLDLGAIRESILGQGDYFIQDHIYRSEHDLILVISTIIEWTELSRENLTSASTCVEKLFAEFIENNDIDRFRDLIVSYDITSKDMKKHLNIDMRYWVENFSNVLLVNIEKIQNDASWEKSITVMLKRFPELKIVKDKLEVMKTSDGQPLHEG